MDPSNSKSFCVAIADEEFQFQKTERTLDRAKNTITQAQHISRENDQGAWAIRFTGGVYFSSSPSERALHVEQECCRGR